MTLSNRGETLQQAEAMGLALSANWNVPLSFSIVGGRGDGDGVELIQTDDDRKVST